MYQLFDGRSDGFEDYSAFLGGPNFVHGMQSNSHGMAPANHAGQDINMALTDKQAKFCREYLVDLNATQAAIRAGYTPTFANRTGPKVLSNVGVAAEIARLQAEQAERTEITADWVLKTLRENIGRAMTAESVKDADGNPTGEYRYEGSVANRALELLGKHLGLFRDKVELSGPAGSPIPIMVYIPANGRETVPTSD